MQIYKGYTFSSCSSRLIHCCCCTVFVNHFTYFILSCVLLLFMLSYWTHSLYHCTYYGVSENKESCVSHTIDQRVIPIKKIVQIIQLETYGVLNYKIRWLRIHWIELCCMYVVIRECFHFYPIFRRNLPTYYIYRLQGYWTKKCL